MATSGVPQFASLYVGDLHPDVTEAMLYEIFNSVGPVGSIRVCRDSVTRKSLGYGYVNFHSVSDAERALDTLNYSSIKGRSCRIMWSQRDPSLRKSGAGNIYVKNLDKNIDNKALYDTFSLFGNILSCKVAADPTGRSYGYGFVHYETEEAAKQSIERVNGMQIGEKTVEVTKFLKRGDRTSPAITNYTNLYIKNIPNSWGEEELTTEFKKFGNITSQCLLQDANGRKFAFVNYDATDAAKKAVEDMNKKDCRNDEDKKADEEKEKDEKEDEEHPSTLLYVGRAQSKAERAAEFRAKMPAVDNTPSRQQGVNLYVKNLDDTIDDVGLKELFEKFGSITSAAAPKDPNGKCKGFGFVCFQSPDEATKAVTEMHLKVVKGKPLYVGLAEKREARQERLRQRYQPGAGKGGKGGKGGPGMGPMQGMQGMPGMMPGMGKGMPMMGGPQMMGKGMPGMMPMQQQMMGKGMQGMPPQGGAPAPAAGGSALLSAAALAAAPPAVQKQMIGEKLFPAITKIQPQLAGKITGMMLEMDNSELLILLDSEAQLKTKVDEALKVIQR
mmetsp:Transcript_26472/g.78931  ORF Transcript_26472/g.78931 Transcript_26472/m.78931 type:complete len:556 (+) Transcript_26472:149-1816(+)